MPYSTYCFFDVLIVFLNSLLRDLGQGFPLDTMNVAPRLLLLENRRKIEPKEIPSFFISALTCCTYPAT